MRSSLVLKSFLMASLFFLCHQLQASDVRLLGTCVVEDGVFTSFESEGLPCLTAEIREDGKTIVFTNSVKKHLTVMANALEDGKHPIYFEKSFTDEKAVKGYRVENFEIPSSGYIGDYAKGEVLINVIEPSGHVEIEGLSFELAGGSQCYKVLITDYTDGSYDVEILTSVASETRSAASIVEAARAVSPEEQEAARKKEESIARLLRAMNSSLGGGSERGNAATRSQEERDFARVQEFNMLPHDKSFKVKPEED